MDAEKIAMQRRIDNLDRHITYLYGVVSDDERKIAKLTVELETVMRALEEEKANHQHTLECAQQFEKDWLKMKRERDALRYDIEKSGSCAVCGNDGVACLSCGGLSNFAWRGLCAENGGLPDE